MGNRIGLVFKDDMEECDIILHSHWMGRDLLKLAQQFYKEMPDHVRSEPCTYVTARFLLWLGTIFKHQINELDIEVQTTDDDCEDNGVWVMDMTTGIIGD